MEPTDALARAYDSLEQVARSLAAGNPGDDHLGDDPTGAVRAAADDNVDACRTPEAGQKMGAFGPACPIPDGAAPIDELVALTGRRA